LQSFLLLDALYTMMILIPIGLDPRSHKSMRVRKLYQWRLSESAMRIYTFGAVYKPILSGDR